MANHSSFCWILSSICWSKIFQKWLSREGEASGSQGTKGEGVVGKAQQEKAGGLKGWKAGGLVGNYSTVLIILLSKISKRKRQTILLRSLELNIFKNSDKILEQKQNRHFLKSSSIVDRLQSQKKCKITKQFQHWIQKDLKWFYNPTISLKQILQTYDDINKTPDNRNLNQQYKRN